MVGFVVYGTQERGAIGMGGVGKGVGTVYPLYPRIFVLLKKMFKNVSSRALIMDISCCRVPQTKKIIFMYMNPNVCPLSKYTEKVIRSNS